MRTIICSILVGLFFVGMVWAGEPLWWDRAFGVNTDAHPG